MDKLYKTILKTCNWDDDEFVEGYTLLMGAIMVAKSPLSIPALEMLHMTLLTVPAVEVLRPLSSWLTGLADTRQLLRILHLSFRNLITVRTRSSPDTQRFSLDDKTHSRRLALLCVVVLNKHLTRDIPGTGYLAVDEDMTTGIPEIGPVSGEVWYACRFWLDHISDVDGPVSAEIYGPAIAEFCCQRNLCFG